MAYTTIKKPSDYFNTKLYTGNGSSQSITGVGFQPDLVWLKSRVATDRHCLFDNVRGVEKVIFSHLTDAEQSTNLYGTLTSFDSDGFSLLNGSSSAARTNTTGNNYVSWNWYTGATASSNTDGSITSTVSANTTSGFSIVSYTGSTGNNTVGHGLGSAPKMVIVKTRDNARNWVCYHSGMGAGYWIYLNQAFPESPDANYWNNTNPTSSVFSVSNTNYPENNGNGENYIAYCFAEKKGFSKFGSYTGNGSTDGTFVYTGFKPAFVIIKRTDSADDWYLYDNKRDTINPQAVALNPNSSGSEFTTSNILDFVSNGFKLRSSEVTTNASGGSYIYMAFAEEPLVGDNPATAR